MDDLTWIKIEKTWYVKEDDQIWHNFYMVGFDKNQLHYVFGFCGIILKSFEVFTPFNIIYDAYYMNSHDYVRFIWMLISPNDYDYEDYKNFCNLIKYHQKEDPETDLAHIFESLLTHVPKFDEVTIDQDQKEKLKKMLPFSKTSVTKMFANYFRIQ